MKKIAGISAAFICFALIFAGCGGGGGTTTPATSVCGNGTVEAGEACDDGNAVTETCTYGQTSCTICNSTCQSAAGATSYCGDGTIHTGNGEECDDGNTTAGDGCSATCRDEGTVTAGDSHTCALTTGGGVKCWGYNFDGRLGDGTTTDRHTPANVLGLPSGVIAVTAGGRHTCALTTGGGVKCWGRNREGQLGDGTTTDRLTPVDVLGLSSGVIAVSAGGGHTCALTTGGGMKCWGFNYFGQLGDGGGDRTTPTDVPGLSSGVIAVAAGMQHTCALAAGGGVKCWGWNRDGQLGDGTTTDRHTPTDVLDLSSGVIAVKAGGAHTCALITGGGVKCWGRNYYGELGDGTTTDRHTPADVSGLSSGATAVAAGGSYTCALTTGGGLKCWGDNVNGQLGDGTTTERHAPVDVISLSLGVSAVATGGGHTIALATGGGVKCWGRNYHGQSGDGTTTDRHTPVSVVGF